ncbi:P-loop containing nucleoside triphosphate hydrolase protein [Mycena rebaudengoi]|nr:P-loop containing nucleoside triphosphate hydrolase protein [Mycena rebaudengoi]
MELAIVFQLLRGTWKHKAPAPDRLLGVKALKETVADIKARVRERLQLGFDLDDWQAELIRRLRQGYDSVMLAGTGYGKSVIFEGLAALNKSKIVIVICPLKALERDQVNEAEKKGLKAVMVNEDTASPEIWASLRQGHANLYYVSPEMALSSSFTGLWQDRTFRNHVQALVIDEAHCIVEWGDDFRPQYSGLAKLRDYIGQDTPILAATATCDTESFNVIWKSLKFGCRPFWGIDVGTDRSNLVYITRIIKNPANPLLDIINIFPAKMDKDTPASALSKCLFYFDNINDCGTAVETLRKILPAHLRDRVQTFKSTLSEKAKEGIWERFNKGEILILCATDAAGMGCNVPDVRYTILCSLTKSVSILAQRWGRTARRRSLQGTCILLVPRWAFRPETGDEVPQKKETKSDAANRKKLPEPMEQFVNAGTSMFYSSYFRPHTDLDVFNCLDQTSRKPVENGWRSKAAQRELSWTVLDLERSPPSTRCCGRCTPDILSRYPPSDRHDARLKAFASDFLFPIPSFYRRQRMDSISSAGSHSSPPSPDRPAFLPFVHKVKIPEQQRDDLVACLEKWRTEKQASRGLGRSLLSKRVYLSDGQLQKLADHGADFLREKMISPDLICKFVPLDLLSRDELKALASVIMDWRPDAQLALGHTPRGGQRQKRQHMASPQQATNNSLRRPAQPISQPSFFPAAASPRGRGRPRGRGAVRAQQRTTAVNDSDFFAPSTSTSVPPRTMSTRFGSPPVPYSQPLAASPASTSAPPLSSPASAQQLPFPASYNPYYHTGHQSYSTPNSSHTYSYYPMTMLPPRYYPPAPNNENGNR